MSGGSGVARRSRAAWGRLWSGHGIKGEGTRSARTAVIRALLRRPWLLASWLLLAGLVVGAQKVVPPPWSACAYPVALFIALTLVSSASPRKP